jgi:hypothetical protein
VNKQINSNPIVLEKRFGRRAAMGSWEGLTCRPATLSGSSGEESDRRSSGAKKFPIADTAFVRRRIATNIAKSSRSGCVTAQ